MVDKAKLEEFNPWWLTGRSDEELALPFHRQLYYEIEGLMDKRFILALVGLRRTGKTTLIHQLIKKLLESDVKPSEVLFFSFDEAVSELGGVLDSYREIHGIDLRLKKAYVFLDEIQKCPNWQNGIKKYYDLYPKLKFVISGSESLFIRKKTKETSAGRIMEFKSLPFSFSEFLKIKGVKEQPLLETQLRPLFTAFAMKGGFPETFGMEKEKEYKEYIRSLVIDRVIYKDIPKTFKVDDPEFLLTLLETISANPGTYIDYLSLSRQFGKDRRVIKDYINYLKESFLIRLVGNYRKNNTSTLRKRKRAYPTDTSFSYLFKPIIDDTFFGRMVETVAVNHLQADSFWKNSHEIDIVYQGMPIEIKYKEKINQEDLLGTREFMKKFNTPKATIITKNTQETITIPEGKITLAPAWKWLLEEQ